MPRVIEIAVPPEQTDPLIEALTSRDDLIGLRVQRGSSVQPPGDILSISTTNRSMQSVIQLLDAYGVGVDSSTSLMSTEPVSMVVPSATERIAHDTSEGTWEEMESVMAKESNTTANALTVMAISGVLAAVGLATDALHLVVAAMLVAPGFEPIVRFSLGIVARNQAWRRGLLQTGEAYGALLLGAGVGASMLRLLGTSPLGTGEAYLSDSSLVRYWTTFTPSAFIVSIVAGVAGALLIAANRSVLTGGVMVALALIPSVTLVASGVIGGEPDIAARGLLRWVLEVIIVAATALLVFGWKRARGHRRSSRL